MSFQAAQLAALSTCTYEGSSWRAAGTYCPMGIADLYSKASSPAIQAPPYPLLPLRAELSASAYP